MTTEQEELELLRLLEEEHRYQAQSDLAVFAEYILGMPPARHHHVMCDGLMEVEAGLLDLLILMLPPGSAKSTYGSVAFPSWYLGRNPHKCVIAASHTGELAERFGRKVRNTIASKEYEAIFPDTKISPDSAAAGRWETKDYNGEYFAAGVGGSVTGRRADLAIIDDPVKSREEADSPTMREKTWAWYRDDLKTRMKPGSAIVLIMTRWHEDDLAGRILEDLKNAKTRVKIISIPMEAMENDPLGRKPGEMLWPEWFTPEMVAEAKREQRTWTSLYQQSPRPIGGGDFKKEWLLNYQRHPAASNKVILVDPASGKRKDRGDYTSIWVVGRGADLNYYLLDGVRDRLNLTERTEKVMELVRKWRPQATFYEEYGMQADIEHIKVEQERQQFRFRIVPIGGPMPKTDRIKRLIPTMQQGSLWVPETMVRQCADGHQRDIIKELIDEMLAFPVGAHDDALDNLARIHEEEVQKYLKAPQPQQQSAPAPVFQPFDTEMGY